MKRRNFLAIVAASGLLVAAGLVGSSSWASGPEVRVYRSPTCGCCEGWARHLEQNGFDVTVIDVQDLGVRKAKLGVPRSLASCHTALVDGYLVEGHVPAADVKRLLQERPDVKGLAVPGMPIGSPGMEGPNPEPYTTWAFRENGEAKAFSQHTPEP